VVAGRQRRASSLTSPLLVASPTDGRTDNAPAFARALAQLERDGGGTLVVPHSTAGSGNESVYASMPIMINVSR
jgi:polygalacturonase